MNNIKLKQAAAALIAALASFSTITSCQSQTFTINNQGTTGHGFKTTKGTITAMHVGGIPFNYTFPQMDIGIDTTSKNQSGFVVSDSPPCYFIDRRGTRHALAKVGNYGLQTTLSIRFFPGESGMPIFARDGSVCGVVLGNVFHERQWIGRMSRITPVIESSMKD